ncbi:MAG: MFS transporter [Brevinema sp.]
MLKNISKADILRYIQFAVVTLAAGSIYPLVYMRTSFQTPMMETFGMDVATLGNMYGLLGMMFLIGYIPSGWLADRVSPKLLLVFSLAATGVTGLWFAQIPPIPHVRLIFLIWGFTTVFTFWGSHMKIVKLLAKKEEQGRFFGILDGGRGLVEAMLGTIVVAVFGFLLGGATGFEPTKKSLQAVIYIYSIMDIIIAILLVFLLTEKKEEKTAGSKQNITQFFADFFKALARVEVWVMSAIIFCGYTVYWTVYYLGGYLQANHGVSVIIAGYITVGILWMRPVGGICAGFLADKFGRPVVLGGSIIVAVVLLFILTKVGSQSVALLGALVILLGLMLYFIRGLYWSLLDYCNIPDSMLGFAIGLISFLGYAPDVLIPKWSGDIFVKYDNGPLAYNTYFLVSAGFGILGIFLVFLLYQRVKKQQPASN